MLCLKWHGRGNYDFDVILPMGDNTLVDRIIPEGLIGEEFIPKSKPGWDPDFYLMLMSPLVFDM